MHLAVPLVYYVHELNRGRHLLVFLKYLFSFTVHNYLPHWVLYG